MFGTIFGRSLCMALAIGLALIAPLSAPKAQESLTKTDVEAIVRDYILQHPEVITDALQELERRRTVEAASRQREAIAARKDVLFNAENPIIAGNPDGDVTLVEFFDYNCGFCKRAHADVVDLIASDPNLKVIYKEWPFLSPESLEAAKVSIAVAKQGRYEEFHSALLLGRGTANGARALEVAEALGFDMERVKVDMDAPETLATLEQNMLLADAIGVTGTPAYVVGDSLILGAQGFATLQQAIAETREKTCQNC